MLKAEEQQANMLSQSDPMETLKASFDLLPNMRNVYENACSEKHQSLVKLVFKEKITYCEGEFRIPTIDPILLDSTLDIKMKGLLKIE